MAGKTTRKAIVLPTVPNREEMASTLHEYAKTDAAIRKMEAEMDQKIADVRKKYEQSLTEMKESQEDRMKQVHMWAENNRDDFDDKKSLDLVHAVIGFRTGNPAVKAQKGFTLVSCLNLLKKNNHTQFIRTKEELDKEAILAKRTDAETLAIIGEAGLEISQTETFFIDTKSEAVA